MTRAKNFQFVLGLDVILYLIERRGSMHASGAVLEIAGPVSELFLSRPSQQAHDWRRCKRGGEEPDKGSFVHERPNLDNYQRFRLLSRKTISLVLSKGKSDIATG